MVSVCSPQKALRKLSGSAWAKRTRILFQIYKRVQEAVLAVGIEPELRPWHPHITMARCRDVSAQALRKFLQLNAELDAGIIRLDAFHLYSTNLTPAGPIHSRELTVHCSGCV
jgi:RNA 2',3'-cyclic 3'-phosphodiesterase